MSRSTAVTVCVVTGDVRRTTRRFLEHLAPSLGPHDNVLLSSGSRAPSSQSRAPTTDETSWRVRGRDGSLRRVTGAEPGLRPVVVCVEDRVEPGEGWLDVLVTALADAGVGAVAPRVNVADGDELLVGVPYRPGDRNARRRFVRERRAATGRLTDVALLAGPCLAVRRDTLGDSSELLRVIRDGFDPAALSAAARALGRRVVVAEEGYLHDPGGLPRRPDPRSFDRPLVSACMIVRDEEEELPRCLASIAGLADEVVVYDTGSLDATVAIAEDFGARVESGYWDDDFGRARDAALAACRGQWILWLDADESLVCDDPDGLRAALLACSTDVEGFLVLIDNLRSTEASSTATHPAVRLFRRAYGHWEGHLHEQVVARAGDPALHLVLLDRARILHRGYLQSHLARRSKGDRNVRTAFGDLAGGSELSLGTRLNSLGRSYLMAGRAEEGVEHCLRAAEIAESPSTERLARRAAVEGLVALNRTDDALEQVALLRAASQVPTLADVLEGQVRLARGEVERALRLFESVRHTIDEDGFEYAPDLVAGERARALVELGRHGAAADVLLESIRASGGVDAHLGTLLASLELAGRDPAEVYAALGPGRIDAFVPQLLQLQAGVADRALEAWHLADPASRPVLAAAAQVAIRLDITRQLVWSSRLRQAGYPDACPLVASAVLADTRPRDRVLASAAAVSLFGDLRARQVFGAAAVSLADDARGVVAAELAVIAPDLVALLPLLPASGPARGLGDEGPPAAGAATRPLSVLVVDRELATLPAAAAAARFAQLGHTVTLLQPLPAGPSSALLGPFGVRVRGWQASGSEARTWRAACEAALAWCASEDSYDAVVVTPRTVEVLPAAHRVLPLATTVVLEPSEASEASAVLPAQARTGLEARRGICIVGNLRCADSDLRAVVTETAAPALLDHSTRHAIAVCGDDPDRVIASALPGAIAVGAVADPSPWLRSARVVVVVSNEDDAVASMDAAAACGTPAIELPSDARLIGAAIERVARLLADDAFWVEAAPDGAVGHGTSRPVAQLTRSERPRPVAIDGSTRPLVRLVIESPLPHALECDVELLLRSVEKLGPPFAVERETSGRAVSLEIHVGATPDLRSLPSGRLVSWLSPVSGGLPAEWVGPLRDVSDELWLPSGWARDGAVASGLAEHRIAVVPPWVDLERFCPEGPTQALRTKGRVRLLFGGELSADAGFDALLETYLTAFTERDDVCLVVCPVEAGNGGNGGNGLSFRRELERAAAAPGPAIELVAGPVDELGRAALYRACDALVAPSRAAVASGVVLEAMACGLPVVVGAGPLGELCDDESAWVIATHRRRAPAGLHSPTAAGFWWNEPDRRELGAALRSLLSADELTKRRGAAARERALADFTADRSAGVVVERISALLSERCLPTVRVPGSKRTAERS